MKRYISILLSLFVFAFAVGCTPREGTAETPSPTPSPVETVLPTSTPAPTGADPLQPPDPLAQAVQALSTEEKVGQLLTVGIKGTTPSEDARQVIEELHVGGIVLFGRNVESAGQLAALTNALKERNARAGNTPLFLCVDEEGGAVSRMPPEVHDLPAPYDYMAHGGNPSQWGQSLAKECAAFGFNVDFAPVLDVWSNSNNTVIGKRAFSDYHDRAADIGADTVKAMMEGGVIPVGKHFPGHGDTATDSHVGLPVVDKTKEELWDMELLPFRQSIEEGLPAMMVAHILMKEFDPDRPASLSPAVAGGLLREELGFDGVVFTDDLTMGAITNTYGIGEAAVLAIEAGCDVALVCHGLDQAKEAYAALLEAVESGRISMSRLDDSVRRILSLKGNADYAVNDLAVEEADLKALNAFLDETLATAYLP